MLRPVARIRQRADFASKGVPGSAAVPENAGPVPPRRSPRGRSANDVSTKLPLAVLAVPSEMPWPRFHALATGARPAAPDPVRFVFAALAALVVGPSAGAAEPPDTMAKRVAACTACHGKEGRATNEGYFPRIAGKPAGYLYHQLVNFREGRRSYGPMTYLIDNLSDAYLQEIALHFASLELPYPPPQTRSAPPALLERGRKLALHGDAAREIPACVHCHGKALTGMQPSVPGLLGLPRDYLNGQLGAWKTRQRRAEVPDCMATIAQRLSAADVEALSAWLSSQAVPVPATPAPRTPAKLPLPCGSVPR